jgi:hypothetical protein
MFWEKEDVVLKGFNEVILSKKYFERNFEKTSWKYRYKIYNTTEDGADIYRIYKFYSLRLRVLETLLIPFKIVMFGVGDTFDGFKRMWFQKRYGTMTIIMKTIKKEMV